MFYRFTEDIFSGTAIINRSEILEHLNKKAEQRGILEHDVQSADILFEQWCMGFGEPAVYEEPTCSNCAQECKDVPGWCPDWQQKREA